MLGFLYADQGNVPPRNLPPLNPASFDKHEQSSHECVHVILQELIAG